MTMTDQRIDCHGLAMTAADDTAVAHYDATITAYLGLRKDTGEHLKRTLAADPGLVLGHVAKGNFMKLLCTPALERKAAQSLAAAESSAEARGANPRETRHIAALRAWCRGDLRGATEAWEAILLDHPRDLLAMRLAHFMHFYMGESVAMRDSVHRLLPAWDDAMPNYGFLKGCQAFGLEETADYARAEAAGREAVERNPSDIWATHAVAHVMEMQGRHREGVAWLAGLSDNWRDCNNFAYHAWWHRCLFHLELGEADAALALYDGEVRADRSEDYLDMSNAISLLWRFEQEGMDVGTRWEELAAKAAGKIDDHFFAFHDTHYMMALAAAGRDDAAAGLLRSMENAAGRKDTTEGPIFAAIGLPLCRAILALRRGEPGHAVDLLLPIRYEIRRLGGSHAQRDVFARTLIAAALAAGRLSLARALLAERTAVNPRNVWAWRRTAEALDGLGDAAGADAARDRAAALLAA